MLVADSYWREVQNTNTKTQEPGKLLLPKWITERKRELAPAEELHLLTMISALAWLLVCAICSVGAASPNPEAPHNLASPHATSTSVQLSWTPSTEIGDGATEIDGVGQRILSYFSSHAVAF